ncbi:MAG: hypothetical protein Q9228_001234 [Teloschistes exilis]
MAQITNGYLTSIDIARQRSYTLTAHTGLKRPLEQVSAAEAQVERDDLAFSFTNLDRIVASKIHYADPEVTDTGGSTAPPRPFDVTSLPSLSLNPLLTLSHPRYGLPESLVKNFASMAIRNIYPWQSSCLLGRGLLTGEKNLVYTAPRGGGKSLVADVLMLKKILGSPNAKAILVLPYVALVQEKIAWLRKANMLVNIAIEQCTIDDLGVVVLDELHMIDDDHRGYLMELLATKLLSLERNVQIVGISATLPVWSKVNRFSNAS